jgi:tetratricopeptide (TPR) repeat protein
MYNMDSRMKVSTHTNYPKTILIRFILAGFVFFAVPCVLAAKESKSSLKEQARLYHAEGLRYQNAGDLETAADFYGRAIIINPFDAVSYNDLGIIYEAQGALAQAKRCYLKALELEPNLLSVYANLALISEEERDLNKAAYYWKKRVELGDANDPWTMKAKSRLADIELVLSDNPAREYREREVIRLNQQVQAENELLLHPDKEKSNKALAKKYFVKAKELYSQGKELTALHTASDASQIDPSNAEIEEFMNKVSTRILSR